MKYNDEPAFPIVLDRETQIANNEFPVPNSGISIRDYFAVRAMSIICSTYPKEHLREAINLEGSPVAHNFARDCYFFADAMMEARMEDAE